MESSFGIHVGVIQCKVVGLVGLSSRLHRCKEELIWYTCWGYTVKSSWTI